MLNLLFLYTKTPLMIDKSIFFCWAWFTLFFSIKVFGQDSISTSKFNFTIATEHGSILPTNPYISSLKTPKEYTGYNFAIRYQSDGTKEWQNVFGNPSYGIGVFVADFHQDRDLAQPLVFYGTYNATAKYWNKWKWDYWVNFGIGFGGNPYNKETYPNPSLGSKTNMYISLGTNWKYKFAKNFDLGLGVSFNHLSNGSTKAPNKGLNFVAPQLSLTYDTGINHKNENISSKNLEFEKFDKIEIAGFYGRKNVFYRGVNRENLTNPYDGFDYSIVGVEGLYLRRYSYKSSFGLGLGITYDESYNRNMVVKEDRLESEKRNINNPVLFSVLPTYRLSIDRLSVNIQAGIYPFKKTRDYDEFLLFQKIGLQYELKNGLFASFGINAVDFHRANYLEWKLGYVLSKRKR